MYLPYSRGNSGSNVLHQHNYEIRGIIALSAVIYTGLVNARFTTTNATIATVSVIRKVIPLQSKPPHIFLKKDLLICYSYTKFHIIYMYIFQNIKQNVQSLQFFENNESVVFIKDSMIAEFIIAR